MQKGLPGEISIDELRSKFTSPKFPWNLTSDRLIFFEKKEFKRGNFVTKSDFLVKLSLPLYNCFCPANYSSALHNLESLTAKMVHSMKVNEILGSCILHLPSKIIAQVPAGDIKKNIFPRKPTVFPEK